MQKQPHAKSAKVAKGKRESTMVSTLGLSGVTRIAAGDRHSLALIGMGVSHPTIISPAWSRTNGFTHGASVQVGTAYRVQLSSDLVNWTDFTNFTATAASVQIRDDAATNTARASTASSLPDALPHRTASR